MEQQIPVELAKMLKQGMEDFGRILTPLLQEAARYGAETQRNLMNKAISELITSYKAEAVV